MKGLLSHQGPGLTLSWEDQKLRKTLGLGWESRGLGLILDIHLVLERPLPSLNRMPREWACQPCPPCPLDCSASIAGMRAPWNLLNTVQA